MYDFTTRDMQLESHLQERCDWNCTYKRHAIGIAPTREMQLELHLHSTHTEPPNR
jgi:hypothetical protein